MDPASRPRRGPYAVAALTAAGGVLAAAAVLMWFLVPVGGDLGQQIAPGRAVTVQVPEAGKLVWTTSEHADLDDLRCEPSPADRQHLTEWSVVSMRHENLSVDANGQRWRGALMVNAEPAGAYSVTCTVPQATGTALAIGDPPRFHGLRSRTVAVLGAIVLASAGLLTGSVMALGGAVRRRRADQRGARRIRL